MTGAASPAAPSWSTTRSTWSTPAPQRTSTWSSCPHSAPGAVWRGTSEAAALARTGLGSRGLSLLTPQGLQRESPVPRFPSDLLSLCVPPSSVCLCVAPPPSLCLQTRPSAVYSGVRVGRGMEKGEVLGDCGIKLPGSPSCPSPVI